MRVRRAGRSIDELTRARAVAFVSRTFIVRIGVRRNGTARAVRRSRLDIAARLARTAAGGIAAEAIDAAAADALRGLRTRRTIGRFARPSAIAFAAHAFVVGVIVRRNERTRPVHTACLGRAARFARSRANRAAADIIDAEATEAFRVERAHVTGRFLAVARGIANRADGAKILLTGKIRRAHTGHFVA